MVYRAAPSYFQPAMMSLLPVDEPAMLKKTDPITILLTDDQMIIRSGLRGLLEKEDDMLVVGEAENGQEAVNLAQKLKPDVVIMDLAMPVLSGLEATRQILELLPATKILVFSSYADYAYIEEVMRLGASGSLAKHAASRELPKAIREVHKGNPYFGAGQRRK